MVALDLDGTLLGNDHQMSQATVDYLRTLHKKGFIVSIATGRTASSAIEHIDRLDLPYSEGEGFPLVSANGALGLRVLKRSTPPCSVPPSPSMDTTELFHEPVPQNVTIKALNLAKKLGFVTNYYIGHDIYANATTPSHFTLAKKYGDLTNIHHVYCTDDYAAAMDRGLPSKLLVLCGNDHIDTTTATLAQELKGEAHVIRGSPPWFVEVLNINVCKGFGFQKMCRSLGIKMEESITFGDGDNDIEFIQMAGKGFAMKNARENVKVIADEVTEWTNEEDGVIRTLQRLEKEGLLHFSNN
uniref:Uncharacterized protein n=1 Tax=Ditylum brightwellii TaxID=49249 RepID=A0A7S4SUZ5_9STRA